MRNLSPRIYGSGSRSVGIELPVVPPLQRDRSPSIDDGTVPRAEGAHSDGVELLDHGD